MNQAKLIVSAGKSVPVDEGGRTVVHKQPNPALELPGEDIARVARRYHVARLALFGSALDVARFDRGSDVDILVSFEPGARVSFLTLARLQRELSALLRRPVDLVPESGLKPLIRDDVLAASQEIYAA